MTNEPMLSKQQTACMFWAAQGLCRREIAERMGISKYTVQIHMRLALSKLGAKNQTHAVALLLTTPQTEGGWQG